MAAMGGQDSRHSWRWRWAIENINQRLVLKKKQLTVSLTLVAQPSKIARMIKRWDWMRQSLQCSSLPLVVFLSCVLEVKVAADPNQESVSHANA
jgi:hypothetical protein